jgi:hypothetical protein
MYCICYWTFTPVLCIWEWRLSYSSLYIVLVGALSDLSLDHRPDLLGFGKGDYYWPPFRGCRGGVSHGMENLNWRLALHWGLLYWAPAHDSSIKIFILLHLDAKTTILLDITICTEFGEKNELPNKSLLHCCFYIFFFEALRQERQTREAMQW